MDISTHSLVNDSIGKPSDMTDETCSALPVCLWRNEEGPWATSFWKPDAEELARLVAGGTVALNLRVGPGQHPVVFMTTYAPEAA